MKKEVYLTEKELERFRKALMCEKERLERELKESQAGLKTSQAEMAGENDFEEEYAESGTATFEREKELSIEMNILDLLEQVNSAIERLERGKYGFCLRCGKPIGKQRLRALPYAELCIDCRRLEEKSR